MHHWAQNDMFSKCIDSQFFGAFQKCWRKERKREREKKSFSSIDLSRQSQSPWEISRMKQKKLFIVFDQTVLFKLFPYVKPVVRLLLFLPKAHCVCFSCLNFNAWDPTTITGLNTGSTQIQWGPWKNTPIANDEQNQLFMANTVNYWLILENQFNRALNVCLFCFPKLS